MIKIMVYAGPPINDNASRPPSVREYTDEGPVQALINLSQEYKSADYFQTRQVVIVLTPTEDMIELEQQKAAIRKAYNFIEESGLL